MTFIQTKAFKKDLSTAKMSDKHFTKFIAYLHDLLTLKTLPKEAKDHDLDDFREFHISEDLLVIYQSENEVIKLVKLRTHSQLFKS